MYTMLVLGIFIGIGSTLLWQDVATAIRRYQSRRQAEFEAAVTAAAAHRKAQADRAWDAMLENVKDPYA